MNAHLKAIRALNMCKDQTPRNCTEVLGQARELLAKSDHYVTDDVWSLFPPGLRYMALYSLIERMTMISSMDHFAHDPDAKVFDSAREMLAELKEADPEEYENLRAKLIESGLIDEDNNDIFPTQSEDDDE